MAKFVEKTIFLTANVVREVITDLSFVQFNQKYCFASAQELMRLNGTTESPIANHFGKSIAG